MLGELFDPAADFDIEETCRPHWSQAGAVVFVTFRTEDSIPKEVIERWNHQKTIWLSQRGFSGIDWRTDLGRLPATVRAQFLLEFNRCREDFLDTCHGACVLRDSELSEIVADSLMYFDRIRYRMGDFVVMPNHVHMLCVFSNSRQMRIQFDSWQKFTATKINRSLGQKGKFWHGDPFDHLVRSPRQYDYLRVYIEKNPKKSRLRIGEYHYRRYHE